MTILHHLPDVNTEHTSNSLNDTVVLITGAGSGIGRQIAIECSKAGAKVIVTDLNVSGCIETIGLCHSIGGLCKSPPEPTDVLSIDSLYDSIKFSRSNPGNGNEGGWGKTPDVVVANAGVIGGSEDEKLIHDSSLGTYPKKQSPLALDTNLQGVIRSVNVIRRAWEEDDSQLEKGGNEMKMNKKRKIVLVASMGGLEGIPLSTLYSTAKHGVVGYWLGLCAELRKKKEEERFQCHVVCPFFSLTPLLPKPVKLLLAGCPKVPPSSVGKTIMSLLSTSSTDLIPIPSINEQVSLEELGKSTGLAVLLPDDQRALVIPDVEYDVLSREMYGKIEEGIMERGKSIDDPSFKMIRNQEALEILSLTKRKFMLLVIVIGITTLFVSYTAYRTPTWVSVLIGVGIGMLGKVGWRKKAKSKSNPSKG